MNNFFLVNEALQTNTIADLETGIANLNTILAKRNHTEDVLMKHHSVYEYNNGHGTLVEFFFSVVSLETQRLVPKFFESLSNYDNYITTLVQFDGLFPDACNAFTGINFTGNSIPLDRQIIDGTTYATFKTTCNLALSTAYTSIQGWWNARLALFPNLVFCDRVWDQVQHLSINDDRFKLANIKLKKLNDFTGKWKSGVFDFKNLGLDNSPDTPTRIADTLSLRTFPCPAIGNQIFSLHIKWSYGKEAFRLYYFPHNNNRKVYVGYIGAKDDIGF